MPTAKVMTGASTAFTIPITKYSLFYVMLGQYICRKPIKSISANAKIGFLILCEACVIVLNILGYDKCLDYGSPLVAMMAAIIFDIIKNLPMENVNINKLWKIDRLCFATYLIHPVYVNIVYKFIRITPLSFGRGYIVAIFIFWILFSAFAFLTSYILSYNKLFRQIVF